MNTEFAKYVDNNSSLTKIDSKIKLMMAFIMIILSFINFNVWVYAGYFAFILIITLIGKLSLKPLASFFKSMWLVICFVLLINIAINVSSGSEFLPGVAGGTIDTVYIILRLLNILLISNLLTSTTKPNELTYAIEFYISPLKVFKIDVHEVALMMSIAIRFIPTLMEETDKIKKAQTSRGAVFERGKYSDRIKSTISLIVPLFTSCFEKSEDLAEAMLIKGYGIGTRTRYVREKFIVYDIVSICVIVLFVTFMIVINGVI